MKDLEAKVAALLSDIDRLDGPGKKRAVMRFIEGILDMERSSFLLERTDVCNIRGHAASGWQDLPHLASMAGTRLSTDDAQVVLWTRAVVKCLRGHGVLPRIVDFKFDPSK